MHKSRDHDPPLIGSKKNTTHVLVTPSSTSRSSTGRVLPTPTLEVLPISLMLNVVAGQIIK